MKQILLVLALLLFAVPVGAQTSTAGSIIINACSDVGSTDAYACSLPITPTTYADGQVFWFKANTSNSAAASINFNAMGARTIVKVTGGVSTPLADNDIRAGQWINVMYDGTNMQMLSVLGNAAAGGGAVSQLIVPLVADGANVAWTNQPVAVTFFAGSHRFAMKVNLTDYTQVRLIVNKQGTAGAAASIVRLRYRTAFDGTVGNWLQIGSSSVQVAVNVQNTVLDSGWIDLAAGAKADVFITLDGSGGDAVLDPAFGNVTAQFR